MNDFLALKVLIKRNIKLYMRDRMTVFFSVLAPLIILLIYILFLGNLQVDMITEAVGEGTIARADVQALINNWMIAGVMGVSCITCSINTNIVMVRDRANGNLNDMLSSPVKKWVIFASYVISCFLLTLCICAIVLAVSLVYLAIVGGFYLSFVDILAIIGITLLSIISSASFTAFISMFIKSVNSLAALNGILSTAVGFLIGAYLPFAMLPSVMQYIACFVPGTYSVGLYKDYFLRGILAHIENTAINPSVIEEIRQQYSLQLDFFGHQVNTGHMVLALIISIAVFVSLIAIFYSKRKANFFSVSKKVVQKFKSKHKHS